MTVFKCSTVRQILMLANDVILHRNGERPSCCFASLLAPASFALRCLLSQAANGSGVPAMLRSGLIAA
jgi:hypothetical protein